MLLRNILLRCETCLAGKQIRQPFGKSDSHTNRPGELIHMDVAGPLNPPTPEGHTYWMVLVDDFSRYGEVVLLKSKSEVGRSLVNVLNKWSTSLGAPIIRVRSDRGTEFLSNELKAYFQDKGIVHELAAPYTPEQNGVAERFNRTIKEKITCMMADSRTRSGMVGRSCINCMCTT